MGYNAGLNTVYPASMQYLAVASLTLLNRVLSFTPKYDYQACLRVLRSHLVNIFSMFDDVHIDTEMRTS